MSDTDFEIRRMEFDDCYRDLFGCYPDDEREEDYEDEYEMKQAIKDKTKYTRNHLGWNRYGGRRWI